MIKLKVVDACINSALTYGCESWGSTPLNTVEILQRKALRMILDVSKTTANEIVYVESGYGKLKPTIYKRQMSFFRKFKKHCEELLWAPKLTINPKRKPLNKSECQTPMRRGLCKRHAGIT